MKSITLHLNNTMNSTLNGPFWTIFPVSLSPLSPMPKGAELQPNRHGECHYPSQRTIKLRLRHQSRTIRTFIINPFPPTLYVAVWEGHSSTQRPTEWWIPRQSWWFPHYFYVTLHSYGCYGCLKPTVFVHES